MPTDGSASKPIFVVGYMHSGTSMLRDILSRHDEVYGSVGETKFWEYLPLLRSAFPDLTRRDALAHYVGVVEDIVLNGYPLRHPVLDAAPASSQRIARALELAGDQVTLESMFRATFEALAEESGASQWLEKTPTHVFHIPRIIRDVPGARFVEIVRDLRDVLASKKIRRATVFTDRYEPETQPFKNLEKAYDPLWDTLSWKAAIAAGRQAHASFPDRIVTVRYEDLARSPAETIRKVCDFLGLAFQPAMLDVGPGVPAEGTRAALDERGRGVNQASVGRWSKKLPPAELCLVQQLARRELERCEYPVADLPAGAELGVPLVLGRSATDLAARTWRRWRMGGPGFLKNTLHNYWQRAQALKNS